MRVLVVGDKEHERTPVVEAIRGFGHEVEEADDGTTAWEKCQTRHFDVVFSDYLMPKMSGLELCKKIRARESGRYTYVMICSNRSQQENVVAGFESGVDDYISKPAVPLEIKARMVSAGRVTELHNELTRKNTELHTLTEELRDQSRSDPLTQVGNRLRFMEDVVELLRSESPFYLAMCDIDNFKKFNDTYGHPEGDRVLKEVAEALSVNGEGSVYRMGGEEFLVILSGESKEQALHRAENVRRAVEELNILHTGNPPFGKVTLSVGLAPFVAQDHHQVQNDLKLADDRLYSAKDNGRNRVVV